MLDANLVILIGFALLFGLCALRVPIGFAMGIAGTSGFAMMSGFDPAFRLVSHSFIASLTNYTLGLIPLFILMGAVATASGMSRQLFRAGQAWLGHFRGGLALATIAACGGFAAICGSSAATAATMCKLALPEMRRLGYKETLATGVMAAGGTLGILIPPSIALAVYGLITQQNIGLLFIAGILPGLVAIALYMSVVKLWMLWRPDDVPPGERPAPGERLESVKSMGPVFALFVFVIGGIYGGLFTPTEAGALGAVGAIVIATVRRQLSWSALTECLRESARTGTSILVVLVGAVLFGYFLTITQTPQRAADLLLAANLGPYGTLFFIVLVLLILGCLIDTLAVVILVVPIVYPIITKMGFDPIWFGVIVTVTVEIGMISPPVGLNVFVIKSIVRDVNLWTIYRGVSPFIAIDLVRLAILIAFPGIATLLPNMMR
ncbi:MAG TPA: TRAP transporter large permease [Burkholderiales bacterium]